MEEKMRILKEKKYEACVGTFALMFTTTADAALTAADDDTDQNTFLRVS